MYNVNAMKIHPKADKDEIDCIFSQEKLDDSQLIENIGFTRKGQDTVFLMKVSSQGDFDADWFFSSLAKYDSYPDQPFAEAFTWKVERMVGQNFCKEIPIIGNKFSLRIKKLICKDSIDVVSDIDADLSERDLLFPMYFSKHLFNTDYKLKYPKFGLFDF